MRLNARAFGISAGLVAAVLFTLCAVGVWLAPEATTAILGILVHVDLTGITRTLTLGSFAAGLVCWALGTGIAAAVLVSVYNGLTESATALPR